LIFYPLAFYGESWMPTSLLSQIMVANSDSRRPGRRGLAQVGAWRAPPGQVLSGLLL
jgi:hypothetical protein